MLYWTATRICYMFLFTSNTNELYTSVLSCMNMFFPHQNTIFAILFIFRSFQSIFEFEMTLKRLGQGGLIVKTFLIYFTTAFSAMQKVNRLELSYNSSNWNLMDQQSKAGNYYLMCKCQNCKSLQYVCLCLIVFG